MIRTRARMLCLGMVLVASGCAHAIRQAQVVGSASGSIIGTWRLVSYVAWDSAGTPQYPFGGSPSGYAAFDETGHAFIQLMRPADASSFGAYYGTYVVNRNARELAITVEGSNLATYLGTRQVRPFRIRDDTLVLGIAHQYQATLVRAPSQ